MRVYLVQHGKALSPEIDPEKGLSPQGKEEVDRLGKFFAKKSFPLFTILHSGKKRAKETAEILGKHLEPELSLEEYHHLNPNDSIDEVYTRIVAEEKNLMVVGHLPFLDRLVTRMVEGREDGSIVEFSNGKTVCLEKKNGGWVIEWVVGIELI